MKLYLSSFRIPTPEILIDLVNKPADQIKVGLITNSKDHYKSETRDLKIRESINYLKTLKFVVDPIDLRKFNDEHTLKAALLRYDLLWGMGGNVFCLRYAMRASGFENIIQEVLEQGVVYGGESAGAAVVGKTLHGIEIIDIPTMVETVIWEGLSLVDGVIILHVNSPDIGNLIDKIINLHTSEKKVVRLNDFEAFVVNGSKERVVISKNTSYS